MIHSPTAWAVFATVVLGMLAIDLGVFHHRAHKESFREAVFWSVVWISVALLFNAGVFLVFGSQKGMEFLAAYLIEKSLSVDNLFVFVAIFAYFSVESKYQHRVLFWGILGALIMRGFFIYAGIALIERFQWLTYLLGGFLVLTGVRFAKKETAILPDRNPVIRLFREIVPVTATFRGQSFFVREKGRWFATPLMVVLLLVELTDVIFATDSVPAVLAVSRDPFIVYSSNVFAILGLRALYFVLAGVMQKFVYLRYGLAAILIFVGGKMLLHHGYVVPIGVSLGVIGTLLAFSIFLSLVRARKPSRSG
jgi:tellurite resistance protein TerC